MLRPSRVLATRANAIRILESAGKYQEAEEHRENLKKIERIKDCLMQLINMDIEKYAAKMKEDGKQMGYSVPPTDL